MTLPEIPNSEIRPIWRMAPGDGAKWWPQCRDRGFIGLGWEDIDDFRVYETEQRLDEYLKLAGGRGVRGAGRIWKFCNRVNAPNGIQAGDFVVANKGKSILLGIGRFTGPYVPMSDPSNRLSDTEIPHARPVEWLFTENWNLPLGFFGHYPTALENLPLERFRALCDLVRSSHAYIDEILEAVEGSEGWHREELPVTADAVVEGIEGTLTIEMRKHYRRDAELRRTKIESTLRIAGALVCEVPGCGFDFHRVYGDIGKGYAHVHHVDPVGSGVERVTRLADLRIVCANCHAMIHRGNQCRALEALFGADAGRRSN